MTLTVARRRRHRRRGLSAARARLRRRLGASSSGRRCLEGGRQAGGLPGRQLRPARDHRPCRASARSARRRSTCGRNPEIDGSRDPERPRRSAGHRDLQPLHAPRLPGALDVEAAARFICPCHGGVYGFTRRGPAGRRCARSITSTRGCDDGQVEVGPRYSVNSEFERFPSYRDPAQPLDGIGQYLYPGRFSTPKQPMMPSSLQALLRAPAEPPPSRRGREDQAARPGQGGRDPAPPTGSTSARRCPAACAGCCSARCRRGRTGSTRSARRRCSRSSRRRSPACSWRCTTRRRRPRPTSRRATSPTTSSSASSCAACTSGARR